MFKLFKFSAIALCFAGRATIGNAQTTSPGPTASPSETAASQTGAQTHSVQVGTGTSFKFAPEVIQANPGDTVEFLFYPLNHSVVRSDYKYPCLPYEDVGWNRTGFFSGFQYVENMTSSQPAFSVLVNDTKPIWFYCSAPDACIQDIMIGVINPNEAETLEVQKLYAANSSYMLQPKEPFPAEASSTMASLTMAPTSAQNPTSSASSSSSAITQPASHSGLAAGAIVGIAIGAAAVAFLVAGLFFFMGRTESYKQVLSRQSTTVTSSRPGQHPPDMLEHGNLPLLPSAANPRPPDSRDRPPVYTAALTSDLHEAPSPNLNSPREVLSQHSFGEGSPAAVDGRAEEFDLSQKRPPAIHEMYAPPPPASD